MNIFSNNSIYFAGIGMLKIFKQGKIEHILLPYDFFRWFCIPHFWETKAICFTILLFIVAICGFWNSSTLRKIEKLKNN